MFEIIELMDTSQSDYMAWIIIQGLAAVFVLYCLAVSMWLLLSMRSTPSKPEPGWVRPAVRAVNRLTRNL